MVDGAIHHGTDMAVEANYVDTHGQSEIGFGITKLLGFDLLPRIKHINKVKLYRPTAGEADLWPGLKPALTRPINWTKIAEQYDQMLKYATAIRTGTASTEAILRRFMKANAAHPTYQAMIELGRAQKRSCPESGVNREHGRRFRFTNCKSVKKELRPCLFEYPLPTVSAPRSTVGCSQRDFEPGGVGVERLTRQVAQAGGFEFADAVLDAGVLTVP